MTTAYPGSLDSWSNPVSTTAQNATGLEHHALHANANDAIEAIEAELGTDPAGTHATVKARLDALSAYTGTGFPEGVVTAGVGAIYTDTAATCGAVRWVKASGTGNTGWKVEYGDTGWRDVVSLVANGTGVCRLRRTGIDVVMLGAVSGYTSGNLIATLPAGFFDPAIDEYLPRTYDGIQAVRFYTGEVHFYSATPAATNFRLDIMAGSAAWPSSLPGTAA